VAVQIPDVLVRHISCKRQSDKQEERPTGTAQIKTSFTSLRSSPTPHSQVNFYESRCAWRAHSLHQHS